MQFSSEVATTLAEACRIIANAGLAEDILGHVSARTDKGIAVRCRGPRERGLLFTSPDEIQLAEEVLGSNSDYSLPSEFPIHSEVLKRRPDTQAVVHAHAPSVIAADLAGLEFQPIVGAYNIPAMRMAAEGIPVYPRSLLINTEELGADVAAALGDSPALILRGHGVVTVGSTIEEAVVRALNLEILARMLLLSSNNGHVRHRVSEEDMSLTPDLGSTFNNSYVWEYQRARLKLAGLSVSDLTLA